MYDSFLWVYFWQNVLHLNEAVYLFSKSRDTHFAKLFFSHFVQYLAQFSTYKNLLYSAELDHCALSALEHKLQARKPVHFSITHTLVRRVRKNWRDI